MKIQVIFGSTREGRKGEVVFNWVKNLVKDRASVEFEFIDLREFELPYFNNPNQPGDGEYLYEYEKIWSKKISGGDGYLIITPEYNHGYPAVLKNSLDLLFNEWNKKPVAFVSYGGSAGGARAVEQLRQVAIELQMVPIEQAVHLIRFSRLFDESGDLKEEQPYLKLANIMLDELIWWTKGLKKLREEKG
jgi:NAD(P)H-dependent FMN reductase